MHGLLLSQMQGIVLGSSFSVFSVCPRIFSPDESDLLFQFGSVRARNDLFPTTERSFRMWEQTKSMPWLPGIEMRTAQRRESNNVRAFYQFINSSLMLFFPTQIFGVFLPFSLDFCPRK